MSEKSEDIDLFARSKCVHDVKELVEIDGDDVWMRCADCFVLFKFTKVEFEQMKEVKRYE